MILWAKRHIKILSNVMLMIMAMTFGFYSTNTLLGIKHNNTNLATFNNSENISNNKSKPNEPPLHKPNYSNKMKALFEKDIILKEYYKLQDSKLYQGKLTENDIKLIFKGVCYEYLIDKSYCNFVHLKINNALPSSASATTETLYNYSDFTSREISINPDLLKVNMISVMWIAAHEWSHVQTGLIAKNAYGYNAMDKRAKVMFPGKSPSMEVLTDCMALNMAHATVEGIPAYLQGLKTYDGSENFPYVACQDYKEVLYGKIMKDIEKMGPLITSDEKEDDHV